MAISEERKRELDALLSGVSTPAVSTQQNDIISEFSQPAPKFTGVSEEFRNGAIGGRSIDNVETSSYTGKPKTLSELVAEKGSFGTRLAFGALEPFSRAYEMGKQGFQQPFQENRPTASEIGEAGFERMGKGISRIGTGLVSPEKPVEAIGGLNDVLQGAVQRYLGAPMELLSQTKYGKYPASVVGGVGGVLGGISGGLARGAAIVGGTSPEHPQIQEAEELLQFIPPAKALGQFKPKATKGVLKTVGEGIGIVEEAPERLSSGANKIISQTISKHVRPSRRPKSVSELKSMQENEVGAIQDIFENRKDLKFQDEYENYVSGETPKSLQELASATQNRKSMLVEEVSSLGERASGEGIKVNVPNAIQESFKELYPKLEILEIENKGVVASVLEKLMAYEKLGDVPVSFSERIIKNFNDNLRSFKKNPNLEKMSDTVADAIIVKGLRNEFYKALDSVSGVESGTAQALRKKMAQLISLEESLAKRLDTLSKDRNGSILDLPDVFSSGEAVAGLIMQNPAMLARAGTQFGTKILSKKFFRDPDTAVNRMFNKLKKDVGEKTSGQIQRGAIGRGLRGAGATTREQEENK